MKFYRLVPTQQLDFDERSIWFYWLWKANIRHPVVICKDIPVKIGAMCLGTNWQSIGKLILSQESLEQVAIRPFVQNSEFAHCSFGFATRHKPIIYPIIERGR